MHRFKLRDIIKYKKITMRIVEVSNEFGYLTTGNYYRAKILSNGDSTSIWQQGMVGNFIDDGKAILVLPELKGIKINGELYG